MEILWFDSSMWTVLKYWTVSCEQSLWSNFSTNWTFNQYRVNAAQGKQEVTLPKGCAWIHVFLWALVYHCHIQITLIPLHWTFLQGPWWRVHAEGALELPIQKSWREHRDTVVHSSLYKPCSLNFLDSYLLRPYHFQKVPQTNFFWLHWWRFYYRKKKDH